VPNANGSNYVGKTCNVKVRAMSFGSAGAPARFDLTIRGVTEVPTSTVFGSVTTSAPSVSANIPTTTAPFINEGTNFRWIYDLDHDDILITPVVGRCEVANQSGNLLPYTYQFQGTPTYHGLDCCTWRIESAESATVGTGQLIFYHNLDASNPANTPPDTDRRLRCHRFGWCRNRESLPRYLWFRTDSWLGRYFRKSFLGIGFAGAGGRARGHGAREARDSNHIQARVVQPLMAALRVLFRASEGDLPLVPGTRWQN
jgi:hypothetical protein